MDTPIPLTAEDWSEIYYALEVKAQRIEEGKYPLENKAGDNQRWAEHLRKIMQKIGPDGTTAIQAGVAGMAGPTAAVPASTEDALIQHGVADLSVVFLQKPFRPIELARRVRAVLHPPASR